MDTSRQRVLARGGRRAHPRKAGPRPSAEAVAAACREEAAGLVTMTLSELEERVAARVGLGREDDLVLGAVDALLDDPETSLVLLAPDVLVHAPALMAGAVLTHRLSAAERGSGHLVADTDLAGFLRVPEPVADDVALEIDEVDGHEVLVGDEDWLAGMPEHALLAVRVDSDGALSVELLVDEPVAPPGLVERLRAVYDAEVAEPGLPVDAETLLLGLRHRHPEAFTAPVPPLEELAAAAGLERRGPEFGHDEEVWARAAEADRQWRLIARLGTGGASTPALEALELLEDPDVDAAGLRRALDLLGEPDAVEAVTEELLGEHDDPTALVPLADRLVAAAGSAPRAAVARWMAAVAAERDGRALDAESHLRAACVEAPGWEFVEDRLAWYEADRGDAAAAAGRWRAIGLPDDHPDLVFAQLFAAPSATGPGRNAPCPCGSGRKYKQCHLGRPAAAPLPERAAWLWRKAIAYLERRGRVTEEAVMRCAEVRAVEDGDLEGALLDPITVDVALHEEGWFARFLAERGPLLPEDEAALGASWPGVARTVYEVIAVRPGTGVELRDLRTGAELRVTGASRSVRPGALLCARAVPDGAGHQLVGAVLTVPPGRERGLLALLDEGDGALVLQWAAARAAPHRELDPCSAGQQGCTARVRVGEDAADVLDEAYTPAGEGWVRLDADDRVLASLELHDDVITVRTLSSPQMDEALADLAVELPEGEVLSDDREPGDGA